MIGNSFKFPKDVASTPVVHWLSYPPLDSRVEGSIPVWVDGFFQSVKILSMTSFGREVKLWVPCRRFTASKRTSSGNYSLWAKCVGLFTLYVRSDADGLRCLKCRNTQQQLLLKTVALRKFCFLHHIRWSQLGLWIVFARALVVQSHLYIRRGNRRLSLPALPGLPAASRGVKLPLLADTRSVFLSL